MTIRQKHLMPLDRCPQDGGLRYLVVRERDRSLDIMVKCLVRNFEKGADRATYLTVAKIKKTTLNPHDKGNTVLGDGGYADLIPLEFQRQLLAIVTKNRKGDKS